MTADEPSRGRRLRLTRHRAAVAPDPEPLPAGPDAEGVTRIDLTLFEQKVRGTPPAGFPALATPPRGIALPVPDDDGWAGTLLPHEADPFPVDSVRVPRPGERWSLDDDAALPAPPLAEALPVRALPAPLAAPAPAAPATPPPAVIPVITPVATPLVAPLRAPASVVAPEPGPAVKPAPEPAPASGPAAESRVPRLKLRLKRTPKPAKAAPVADDLPEIEPLALAQIRQEAPLIPVETSRPTPKVTPQATTVAAKAATTVAAKVTTTATTKVEAIEPAPASKPATREADTPAGTTTLTPSSAAKRPPAGRHPVLARVGAGLGLAAGAAAAIGAAALVASVSGQADDAAPQPRQTITVPAP